MWDHLRSGLEPVSAASPALAVATLPLRYQESPQVQTLKGKHFYLVIFFHGPCKQEKNTQHNIPFRNKLMAQFGVNFTAQWSESDLAGCPHTPRRRSTESAQPWCCLCRAYKQDKFKWRHYVLREKALIIQMPLELARTECRERKQARPFIFTLRKVVFQKSCLYSQMARNSSFPLGF